MIFSLFCAIIPPTTEYSGKRFERSFQERSGFMKGIPYSVHIRLGACYLLLGLLVVVLSVLGLSGVEVLGPKAGQGTYVAELVIGSAIIVNAVGLVTVTVWALWSDWLRRLRDYAWFLIGFAVIVWAVVANGVLSLQREQGKGA